jgi:hypothetical protein
MPNGDSGNNSINWTTLGMGLIGLITLLINLNCNHAENLRKAEAVEHKQDVQVEKAAEVKKVLEEKTILDYEKQILDYQRIIDDMASSPEEVTSAKVLQAKVKKAVDEAKRKKQADP